jgi:hypothetical protein
MDRYQVALVGWPEGIELNPANLTLVQIQEVLDVFWLGTCYWDKLSNNELVECHRQL